MKKAIKLAALFLILALAVTAFVACNKNDDDDDKKSDSLDGKYVLEGSTDDSSVYLEVKGDEITMTANVYGASYSETYTYEIKDDKIYLTDADGETSEGASFERDGKTLIIDGEKYTKE